MTGFEPSFTETEKPVSEYCYFCQRKILPKDNVKKIGENDIIHTNDICDKMYDKLLEKMADKAHDVWGKWMKHLYSKIHEYTNDNVLTEFSIPLDLYYRWGRQMNTPYDELSDEEKKSDQEIGKEYLDLLFKEKS